MLMYSPTINALGHLRTESEQYPSVANNYKGLCFVTATTGDHFREILFYLETHFKYYPCMPLYVYDLGELSKHQRQTLEQIKYVKVLTYNGKGRPVLERNNKVFKAIMMMQFIEAYGQHHQCRVFFYGDTSIRFTEKKFDDKLFEELKLNGIVASRHLNDTKKSQIAFTHPRMYDFFGVDREASYKEGIATKNPLLQIQSGLMMVDTLNETMKKFFFAKWENCALIPECIHNGTVSGDGLRFLRFHPFLLKDGTPIYRLLL